MTDPFNTIQKGKFPIEKITKNPELLDLEESINSINQTKKNPSYITLKAVLCALESVLISQKQIMRELQELKK